MNLYIPVPITFNPLKHHAEFILQQIKYWQQSDNKEISTELLSVGENLIDLYTGKLTVTQICLSCLEKIPGYPLTTCKLFMEWLNKHDYRKLILHDGSVWVIRTGTDTERFIHIHPAKYSPLTVRIRAATLKTVIALLCLGKYPSVPPEKNLKMVNEVRKHFAGLSPVKGLESNKGIFYMWSLFSDIQNRI